MQALSFDHHALLPLHPAGLVAEWDELEDLRDAASPAVQEIVSKRFFSKRKNFAETAKLLPDGQLPIARIPEIFATAHNPKHPLRIALDKLQSLETIRIIEGKA